MKKLEGSCHCGRVAFEMETAWTHPIMWCYCSRCRKTCGSPSVPFMMGRREDFSLTRGEEQIRVYEVGTGRRFFCGICGTSLHLFDSRWPESCWITAAAVDTPLPTDQRYVHIYVGSKVSWFPIHTPGPQFEGDAPGKTDDYHREWGLN